jgi:hypothetical protein
LTFGGRYRQVQVELTHEPRVEKILEQLAEFLYKNAELVKYKQEVPNLWHCIYTGVLEANSSKHKIFKANLEERIKQNILETGIDPRINGPPEHIAK